MAKYLKANKTTFSEASEELLDKARQHAMKQAAETTYAAWRRVVGVCLVLVVGSFLADKKEG